MYYSGYIEIYQINNEIIYTIFLYHCHSPYLQNINVWLEWIRSGDSVFSFNDILFIYGTRS